MIPRPMQHLPLYLQSDRWQTLFWISLSAFVLHEVWVFSRDRRAVKGVTRDRGSLQAIVVLQNLGFLTCFVTPFVTGRGTLPLEPAPLFYTAVALFWTGLLVRFWSVLTLGRYFRTSVIVQDDHRLVTTGPYRLLRNPSYSGALLEVTGLGLMTGNAISLLAVVSGAILGYAWRIRAEELALRERFGPAWDDYRRRTWALIPLLW
jgi:protein-S-isoprenylcysteine O-methyltransferase